MVGNVNFAKLLEKIGLMSSAEVFMPTSTDRWYKPFEYSQEQLMNVADKWKCLNCYEWIPIKETSEHVCLTDRAREAYESRQKRGGITDPPWFHELSNEAKLLWEQVVKVELMAHETIGSLRKQLDERTAQALELNRRLCSSNRYVKILVAIIASQSLLEFVRWMITK